MTPVLTHVFRWKVRIIPTRHTERDIVYKLRLYFLRDIVYNCVSISS